MNPTRTIELPGVVRRALGRFRRRWRLVGSLTGTFVTLGFVVAGVALAVAADRLLRLGPGLRAICLGAILVALALLLGHRVFWPAIRRLTDRDAAIRLGGTFPRLTEDLVTAVELTSRESERGISRSLVRRALDQIAGRASVVDPRASVPARPLLMALAVFLCLTIVFELSYLLRPEAVHNALTRLLMPHREVPYYSYTRLRVTSGDPVVAVGDRAALTAAVSGRMPHRARILLRSDPSEAGARAETVKADMSIEAGEVRWQSGPLFADLSYRVLAGDAISDWHRVRVVPAPTIGAKKVLLGYPAYTGGRVERLESVPGLLEVVEGATVEVHVLPAARGDEPEFRCGGELVAGPRRLPLAPGDGDWLCSAPLRPSGTTEYAIRLSDGFGLSSRTTDSVVVRTVPDRMPQVTIASPAHDVLLLPGEAVAVAAVARDDFGLRELNLATRRSRLASEGRPPRFEQRWRRRRLEAGGKAVREVSGETILKVAELGLTPGSVLEYKAAAADYADDAAVRTGYSSTYRIVVISETEHLNDVLRQVGDIRMRLLRQAALQKIEAAGAGKLAEKAAGEAIDADARDAQQREQGLARSTEQVARDTEQLAAELTRNPSASPGMMSDLEQLARAVRSVAAGPMNAAAEKMGQAARCEKEGESKRAEQAKSMTEAKNLGEAAARELERLARTAGTLQTRGHLEKLASEADLLAARQRDLKEATLPIAMKTAGRLKRDLPEDLGKAVDRLADTERSIQADVGSLEKEVRRVAAALADTSPADAATAEKVGGQMEAAKLADRAGAVARAMQKNILFSPLAEQEKLARQLADLAKRLRREPEQDFGEAVAREIDQFIARQRKINTDTKSAIAKTGTAGTGMQLGRSQLELARDVTEQAGAIHLLARELEGFDSQTAMKLEAAGGEMRAGANELYLERLGEGLRHGQKALALLKEAAKNAAAERERLSQACGRCNLMRAALLLQRILNGQKRVNRGTGEADDIRARDPETFARKTVELTRRQTAVKLDTDRLARMIRPRSQETSDYVSRAGEKMDASRAALAAGDTGKQTRIVQREIIAMLEPLLKRQQQQMGGMGLAGARMRALMRLMAGKQSPGAVAGGYSGGSNADVLPARLGPVGDESWRWTRSKLDEQIGAAYDAEFPAEFRDLLNAYFDRLRKEAPR